MSSRFKIILGAILAFAALSLSAGYYLYQKLGEAAALEKGGRALNHSP